MAEENLLLMQSGGPTAVINASLIGAVAEATARCPAGMKILGVRHAMAGLLHDDVIDLGRLPTEQWAAIRLAPGAALGSSRLYLDDAGLERLIPHLRQHSIRYVVTIGGNGSMAAAADLARVAARKGYELHIAGVPKTIDNDLVGTDFCPGYGSCARFYAQAAIDLETDVRALPTPVSILEVMGRRAGWLTAATALARDGRKGAPHCVYVPEVPLSGEKFLGDVLHVFEQWGWVVVAVAEGVVNERGEPWEQPVDVPAIAGFGGQMIGDVGPVLARLVTRELGLRARCEKPGLTARASRHLVSSVDREAAEDAARFAVRELFAGNTEFMAGLRCQDREPFCASCVAVPLADVGKGERLLPPEYLSRERREPNAAFLDYARPLIGGALMRHANLLR